MGPAADRSRVPPSDASLAWYPPVGEDELTETLFEKRTVYIAEFARRASSIKYTNPTLQDLTFVECGIVGPAVMVDLETGRMEGDLFPDCKWDEGLLDAYWAPDFSLGQKYTGVIALEDCLFRGCRFSQVVLVPARRRGRRRSGCVGRGFERVGGRRADEPVAHEEEGFDVVC